MHLFYQMRVVLQGQEESNICEELPNTLGVLDASN